MVGQRGERVGRRLELRLRDPEVDGVDGQRAAGRVEAGLVAARLAGEPAGHEVDLVADAGDDGGVGGRRRWAGRRRRGTSWRAPGWAGGRACGAGPTGGPLNQPATSTTRSVPDRLYRPMVPPAPSEPSARLGMVWPAPETFRFDASGTAAPPGNTVTKPGASAPVAVTFMSTAADAGGGHADPAGERQRRAATPPVRRGRGSPVRVSRARAGTSGVNSPSVDDGGAAAGDVALEVGHEVERRLAEERHLAVGRQRHHHEVGDRLAGLLDVEVRRQRPRAGPPATR